MTEESEQKSPNEILAEQIVADLIEAGLIPATHKEEAESKLSDEGTTQDDWSRWVDLATAPEGNEETDNE